MSSSAAISTAVSAGARSSNAWKRSTGSSSAMSGRSSASDERGDLGELAVLGRELGGGRDLDRLERRPSERWVNVENQRSDSTSMSNRSTRTAWSSVAGKTSRMPPRIANWPRSSTWSTRS